MRVTIHRVGQPVRFLDVPSEAFSRLYLFCHLADLTAVAFECTFRIICNNVCITIRWKMYGKMPSYRFCLFSLTSKRIFGTKEKCSVVDQGETVFVHDDVQFERFCALLKARGTMDIYEVEGSYFPIPSFSFY